MTHVLHINSSLWKRESRANKISDSLINKIKNQFSDPHIVYRELSTDSVPHLSGMSYDAFSVPENELTAEQKESLAYSDLLIEELKISDIIVLTAPMYNFGTASSLKAYFDHVARVGRTFRYTDEGIVGLLENVKLYVVSTRGGQYQGTAEDTETSQLRQIFNLMGVTDIKFIYAEGMAFGDEVAQQSIAQAHESIEELVI